MSETGETLSFRELDARANRVSQLLRSLGLQPGDRVALWLDNHVRYLETLWGIYNAGLLYVPVGARLTVAEAAFIVRDSEAKLAVTCAALDHTGLAAELDKDVRLFVMDGPASWEDALADMPSTPVPDETRGVGMLYSSGTTGRPKGILPVIQHEDIHVPHDIALRQIKQYEFGPDMVYLSPAPLYHSAPIRFCMSAQQVGGTVIVMNRFDPAHALTLIDTHKVTHAQFVPTMFIRMLQLPELDRKRFDGSSLRCAVHAAAPCPISIKEQMIVWWGPIIEEYYSGSEGLGQTAISSIDWLAHKGSVGKAIRGIIHVLDEDDNELAPNQTGTIYFEGGSQFVYYKDPEKTARSFSKQGWGTYGDVGHVDAEGYLYLTDRRDYTMIIGGVNVYPQEAENLLATHPDIADVAVFGIPNAEYGEEVKAVVQVHPGVEATPELAGEIINWCRARLTTIKCPRSVDFEADMPREPTGKLLKRRLKARYWPSP